MKNKIYLIGLASALALTSCTNESALNKSHQLASKTVNLKELTKNTKTNKEASEKLALFAEKMAQLIIEMILRVQNKTLNKKEFS